MQMKIILISIGTLGDIEPFLSTGEILKEKGHQVICVCPEQFRDLAESSYMEFSSMGSKFMASPVPYIHYARGHSHVAFNSNYGPFLNKLTYSLAGFGLSTTVMICKRCLEIEERISRKQIRNAIHSNKAIYTISPSLFSRPDHWDDKIKILGYQGRKKTKIIIEALERNSIPAIINTAAGGLCKPDKYDSGLIHFVSQIPYDWIFPKMYGVIHHGGSGTAHMALKYGCAAMVIPHINDQFVWNKIVSDMGAGPRGKKLARFA
jgi:hypothetical protein